MLALLVSAASLWAGADWFVTIILSMCAAEALVELSHAGVAGARRLGWLA